MSSAKLIVDDAEYDLDLTRFMLSEAIALEEEWGLSTTEFAAAVASGAPPLRVVGAMVWLVKVRSIAAVNKIPFREAAQQLPVAVFDTNLTALRIEDSQEPENPTPGGTRTRATRTSRTTSAAKRAKRD